MYDYIVWGGVIYVQVYRQKVKAVRAWGWSDGYTRLISPSRVVRWLYSSHYSMVGVVMCGNQKVMATHDSILHCEACPCVDGCQYCEYSTKRACGGQMAILVSLLYGGGGEVWNQNVTGTFDSLLLYGSRYVSDILAATLTLTLTV